MTDHEKRLRFHEILDARKGVVAPSVPDPMFARLVQDCGYPLMHLAGNGMHRSLILPDESMVTMTEMAERAATIGAVLDIPLMVDGETGYGGVKQMARAVQTFERAGASGIRFEDSLFGANGIGTMGTAGVHTVEQFVDKIKAAVDARTDESLVLVIRVDSHKVEGLDQMMDRAAAYIAAGADAINFHVQSREDHETVGKRATYPLLQPWPRGGINDVNDLFATGCTVALMTSNVSLAGLAAARTMLLQLRERGNVEDYFNSVPDLAPVRHWYEDLGFRPTKPFVG
jgi:2-methylisocitrate lyase-like PEP mutase family enzyme